MVHGMHPTAAGCPAPVPEDVIGRRAGRRGENQPMGLFRDNAMNPTDCMKYHLKPSRIQDIVKQGEPVQVPGAGNSPWLPYEWNSSAGATTSGDTQPIR